MAGSRRQALATSFLTFAIPNIVSRIGGSPQHPVGNGLLAEQFPPERRGFAISAHIAGGNVGHGGRRRDRRAADRRRRLARRLDRVRGAGDRHRDRDPRCSSASAARTAPRPGPSGTVRAAFGRILRDRDLRWLYLTSVLGGGGRGLGVVNLFVLLYLTLVIGLDEATAGLMYGALIVFSVPMPLIAGWLSDRFGRKPLIIGVYLGGAVGFVVFLLAGSSIVWLWVGIVLMGLFSFAESPQLQALLGDIAPPSTRDASYALYFTLAFGVGSLWVALYGVIIERGRRGDRAADRVRG